MTSASTPRLKDPWYTHSARIAAACPEIPGVTTYHIQIRVAPEMTYTCRPGQFNMIYLPGIGEAAISVSGYDNVSEAWLHTIRVAGSVTEAIQKVGVGGSLAIRGPFGRGWPLNEMIGHEVLFVAGGIGLAPLRPAVEWALDHADLVPQATLVYGARSPDTLLYRRQFDAWESRGLRLEVTVDRADLSWEGNIGVVPQLIDRLTSFTPTRSILFTCGPEVMMRFAIASALERGLSPDHVWLTMERNMQCAVGFCGHCQLGPAFVCKDGPVFRYDQMLPYLDVEGL